MPLGGRFGGQQEPYVDTINPEAQNSFTGLILGGVALGILGTVLYFVNNQDYTKHKTKYYDPKTGKRDPRKDREF